MGFEFSVSWFGWISFIHFEEESKVGKDFRSRQQDRLFPVLKEREEQKDQRSKEQGIPRFYFGKERQLHRLELEPSGKRALLIHGKKGSSKRDKMPVYLNRNGNVVTQSLRPKVGEKEALDHRLHLLNLESEQSVEIELSSLPNFSQETTVFVETSKWSSNGRLALSLFSEDFEERWIVEVDFQSASLRLIEHLHDDAWHAWDLNEFAWTPDGSRLWFQSEKTGFAHLYLWDGTHTRQLTRGPYEVTTIQTDPKGRGLFFRANKEDSSRYDVHFVNFLGEARQISDLGGQTHFDLSPDGENLVLLHSKTARPPEVYLQRTEAGAQAKQLTNFVSREFLKRDWTKPKFIDVPSSHHGEKIRSKLYLPPTGVKRTGAAVLFVHGAGYLQNSDRGWSYYFREFMFHTLLTQRGIVVLDMDYRASAGYGRDWRAAIYRQMGTPELEDLKDGVSYLVRDHGIDSTKVGIYGGSYGGFMTLMGLFKEPDLFACGAALRPVTDWAQYEHDYTARILNTPAEDPEAYLRSSPIEFAQGLKKPLLLCHGMLDDNVVAQDTVRLAQRLIQLKKKNWEMALYPIEPHGFVEPESWLDEYRRILKLFEVNLSL